MEEALLAVLDVVSHFCLVTRVSVLCNFACVWMGYTVTYECSTALRLIFHARNRRGCCVICLVSCPFFACTCSFTCTLGSGGGGLQYLDTCTPLGWKQSCVTWSTGYISAVVYRQFRNNMAATLYCYMCNTCIYGFTSALKTPR